MQYTTLLIAAALSAFTSVVSAKALPVTEAPPSQITAAPAPACTLTELMPACGIPCVSSAAIGAGCTSPMDFACQCSHAAQMQAAVMPCVMSACGMATAPIVGSVANAICTECVAPPAATATATATAA
ncbi:hypothetical protein B0H66DRAFT_608983 [Apodospora peruviana]|uniref:CFEM domain-containing protein n=1 Tax=Apodospora peruviana TaxID=516989 RepID=A0AAE0HS54_9PEZI|nr:hypothetical protein B0H66DRAFT_608983 [Apodospora peruviana]